jgi:hypothetical protein
MSTSPVIHVTPDVSISVPSKDIPDVLALQAEERAFIEKVQNAKSVDGGRGIRIPMEYEKEKIY